MLAAPPGGNLSSIAELILPSCAGGAMPAAAPAKEEYVCVFKEMKLAGSLLDAVVQNGTVTSIPDVQRHVSEQPSGLPELLFNVAAPSPKAMLVLPLFTSSGVVRGALHLLSNSDTNLVWMQADVEVLLVVAGEAMLSAMSASRRAPPSLSHCGTRVCHEQQSHKRSKT